MGDGTVGPERKTGFPRIVELINVDKFPKPPAQGPEAVLKVIAERMRKPLDELWCIGERWNLWDSQWNIYDPTAPPSALKIVQSGRPLLEEQWARGISELLMGSAYDGPDIETGNQLKIEDIYKSFCEDKKPFVAIACACQMLSTYMVLSRGYSVDYVGVGLDCDGNEGLKVFSAEGGAWDKGGPTSFKVAMTFKHPLQPGSCYSWVGWTGKVKQKGSHVVSLLRVDTKGKVRAQLLDTGAAQDPARPTPSCALDPTWDYSGNYDNEGSVGVRYFIPGEKGTEKKPEKERVGGRYMGLGTPATRSDPQLQQGIDRMKKTRPYGLARLFVATAPYSEKNLKKEKVGGGLEIEVPESLVFMSKLLRMWGPGDTANYTIARCQYALRSLPDWKAPETPGTPEQEAKTFRTLAWWVFFSPQGALAQKLFDAERDKSLDALASGLGRIGVVPPPPKGQSGPPKLLSDPLLVVRSLPNGRTNWAFVRRALGPVTIGSIPSWMQKVLLIVNHDTVFGADGLTLPDELDDKKAAPAP